MAKIAIIAKTDNSYPSKAIGEICSWYDADAPQQSKYGGPFGSSAMTEHVMLESGDYRKMVAELVAEKWTKEGEPDEATDPMDPSYIHEPAHYILTEDATLAAEVDAQDAAQAQEAAVEAKKQRREHGLKMVDLIQVKNDEAGITTAQTLAFMAMPEVQAIQGLLSAGALESAKDQLNALDSTFFDNADVVLTASDRDDVVAAIDAFIA